MPANQPQDWTDDADFWNEAWADMAERLEAAPPARKRALGWWWVLAGVLVLVVALGSWLILLPDVEEPALVALSPGPSPQERGDVGGVTVALSPGPSPQERGDVGVVTANDSLYFDASLFSSKEQIALADKMGSSLDAPNKSLAKYHDPISANEVVKTSPAITPESYEPSPLSFGPPLAAPQGKGPGEREKTTPEKSKIYLPTEINNEKLIPLEPLDFTLIKSLSQTKNPKNLTLTAEAGTNLIPNNNQPGAYLGIGLTTRISGRWQATAGLRYTRTYYSTQFKPNNDLTDDEELMNPDSVSSSSVGLRNADVTVVADAAEISLGLAYRIGSRWQVGIGTQLAYQLNAKLRNETTSGIASPISLSVGNTDSQFNGTLFDQVAVSNYFNQLNATEAFTVLPDPQRFLWRAEANVTFQLSKRFAVALSADRLMSTYDANEVIDIPRLRLSLGAAYRFR